MSVIAITLYGFEILAALAALGILFVKNVFHAAILLIVCLLALAGVYVLYHAEFIAVTQILVYAGGVLVLIIFGIMLTARTAGKQLVVTNHYVLAGSLVCLFLAGLFGKLYYQQHFYQKNSTYQSSDFTAMNKIGISLMSEYALVFEVVGVLLLVALLGAAVTASSFKK